MGSRHRGWVFLLGLCAMSAFVAPTRAQSQVGDLRSRCEGLSRDGADGGARISATLAPAGTDVPKSLFSPGFEQILHAGDLPATGFPPNKVGRAFCRVQGVVPAAVHFEIWLPAEGWNGRLLGVGNGGVAGSIPSPLLKAGVEAGYATVGSDLGHVGDVIDARFAVGRPDLLVDWGHRATHVMTLEARKAIAAFYGTPPAYAYFAGCSGGGRQAMMEAQRYPEDYDGILAGDPTFNFTRLVMAGRLWGQLAMLRQPEGAGYIPADKIAVVANAVIAACDGLDGVKDGILEDPRQCRFDPATIQCRGIDGDACLTGPQVKALGLIYAGARDSRGRALFSGYSPGGEMGKGGWQGNISGEGPYKALQWLYAKGTVPVLLKDDPAWDISLIDYDHDIDRALNRSILGEPLGSVIDAYDPDLSAFAARGGKIIHYHGWADAGVPPLNSIAYYEQVVDRVATSGKLSANKARARTRDFYRLFMAPGMQHCLGGPGPDQFDALTPLRAWVEQGKPPERIIATRAADGKARMTRPLCPFPTVARWSGKGSSDDAANFACVASTPSKP